MTKQRIALLVIMAGILCIGIIGSIIIGILGLSANKNTVELLKAQAAKTDAGTKENDVVIADQYTICSTENISNAYKSGNRSGLTDKEKETLDMASDILNRIISTGMSNYEKEKAVYEWMTAELKNDAGILTVIPTTTADCDNPYGVLKYHNAVCVGYATTFRLFMQMMNIDCMVIHNSDCFHSWNLVKLGNNWYHTDIYSDSGKSDYSHFNMNDIMESAEQSWDASFFPASSSLEYNMAYLNSEAAESVFIIPDKIRKAIDDGKTMMSFKFPMTLTENDAQVSETMLGKISELLSNSADYSGITLSSSWSKINEGYLLAVFIHNSGTDDPQNPEITEENTEKMNNAMEKAFGDIISEDPIAEPDDYENGLITG